MPWLISSEGFTPYLSRNSVLHKWIVACCLILWFALPFAEAQKSPSPVDRIHWYEWGGVAFQKARLEDKLILLDLTAVWCHACHVMDETAYADPAIVAILNTSFVPIRVDTDQHPDLEARYRAGGWPTTSLLLPTGEILFQANALTANELLDLLHEVGELYAQERGDLQRQAKRLWTKVQQAPKVRHLMPDFSPDMVEQSVAFMKSQFDAEHGGFRSAPKFFEPEAIHLVLALGYVNKDAHLTHMGLHTLDRQLALLDPAWGGFYRYAEQADWTDPHYEKMLTVQAGNLQNYLEAFQLTGKPVYRETAQAIVTYVWDFLADHTHGQFWESQDADLRGTDGTTLVSGKEFFLLNAEERPRKGQPLIDRRVFTGSNAWMAEVFLEASWVLERPELREFALRVLTQLDQERWTKEQGLRHVSMSEGTGVLGLLSDHVRLGRALLAAFQSTGEKVFLNRAEDLAERTQALLEDPHAGGFFDGAPGQSELGLLKMPIKPSSENLQAALWYLNLFHLTQKLEYLSTAERTIRSVISANEPLPIALMGKTLDRWFRGMVHVAVVGDVHDPRTLNFMAEGYRIYFPGKLVLLFNPEQGPPQWGEVVFPYQGRPIAFACTDRLCSPPVTDHHDLGSSILKVAESN